MLLAAGCHHDDDKFDRTKWYYGDGLDFPYREKMLGNMISSRMLIGLHYPKVVGLLHSPQERDGNTITYDISSNYNLKGRIHKKYLVIAFTKDSVVENVTVKEKDLQ
jgi:hypothetical protein